MFPLGTKCAVQMPHWLSWAPTSNLNPSLNLKNGSLLSTRDREEECLASPPLLYNVTYCLYLPLFFFTSLVTPFSFMHPIPTHVHPPPRPGHRTNSDPSLCVHSLFSWTSTLWKEFVIEARLWQHALGQSLVGPSWMDELSGSQSCDDDDPDFMKAQMGRYSFLPTHSQREAPLSEIPPGRVWK